jgi:hypothetical protein
MAAVCLLAVPGMWLALPTAVGAPPVSAIAQHIGIPAYFPPSASYNVDEAWGPAFTGTPPTATGGYDTFATAGGFAIANVVNGPDYAADVNYDYSGTLAAEHNSGTKVIGYVDTGYFGTTGLTTRAGYGDVESWRDQIEQDVNAWYEFYGADMDGIFFDEAQNDCGPSNAYANLYAEVSAYVKDAHPGALTVINPGISVPSCYQNSADTIVTFEGPESSYTASAVALDWTPADPDKIMHIVYGVAPADLATVSAQSKIWGAGYVDITDEGAAGNPPLYKVLPSYLPTEIADAVSANDAPPPAPPSGLNTYDVQFTTAQLNWDDTSGNTGGSGANAYDVYVKQRAGEYHWIRTSAVADYKVPDVYLTGLTPGVRYTAYVVARDAAGNVSVPSNTYSWTQESDRSAVPPTTPGPLSASATTYSTTELSWPAAADGGTQGSSAEFTNGQYPIAFYRVYEDDRQILQVPGDAVGATVTGMFPGTSHLFAVDAVDAAGNASPASPAASVTTRSFTGSSVASTGLESYATGTLTLSAHVYLPFSFVRAFIDADNNPTTGYTYNGIGADYVIENGRLFSLSTGGRFTPTLIANAPASIIDYVLTWIIPTNVLTNAGATIQVSYQAEGFAPAAHTPTITITEQ